MKNLIVKATVFLAVFPVSPTVALLIVSYNKVFP